MIDDELEQPQSGAEGYTGPDIAAGSDEPGGREGTMEDPAEEGGIEAAVPTSMQDMAREKENAALLKALREAGPGWLEKPQPGAEGFQLPISTHAFGAGEPSGWNKTDYQAPFPESVTTDVTETTPAPSVISNIYSFQMDDATDNEGAKVLIHDGEVSTNGGDGMLPDGMGNDDFILTINADGDDVWVEVTYDTGTLDITSLTIGTGTGIPDSSLGNAYVLLGYVTFGNLNPKTGFPTSTDPHNTQCGDINIDQIYGAFNGQPALFLLSQIDAPQPIM